MTKTKQKELGAYEVSHKNPHACSVISSQVPCYVIGLFTQAILRHTRHRAVPANRLCGAPQACGTRRLARPSAFSRIMPLPKCLLVFVMHVLISYL